jgi:hypothetical protein
MPATPFGLLAADVFRARLRALGLRSSTRLVVDYLPGDVAAAFFDALMENADETVEVHIPNDAADRVTEMLFALHEGGYDLIPFRVSPPDEVGGEPNHGSEGFASCLRDHFATGESRPRVLVVVTASTIETQRSAQDARADRQLLTLDGLLGAVLDHERVPAESPLRKVARAYRAHRDESVGWMPLVQDFEGYVEKVAPLPAVEQGRHLPDLGCFLPDPRADYADGATVKVLEDKVHRQRQRGEGRLFDNALLHGYLSEIFSDPVVDAETALLDVFDEDPDRAGSIAAGKVEGLDHVELDTFAGIEQKRTRQKNQFERNRLTVEGASAWRLLGQGTDSVLVVTSPGPFTVRVPLVRAYDEKRERARLVVWERGTRKAIAAGSEPSRGALEARFVIRPKAAFTVSNLVLARGARSVGKPIDSLTVVIYQGGADHVVVEEGRLVSLEDQAWLAEGKRNFHRHTMDASEPLEESGEVHTDEGTEENPRAVITVGLIGTDLEPRVVGDRIEEVDEATGTERYAFEPLLELACTTTRLGYATTQALRSQDHYLDAVLEIYEGAGRYRVDLAGGNTREVWAAATRESPDPFATGRAVARFLLDPSFARLERKGNEISGVVAPANETAAVVRFRAARTDALAALRALAEKRVPRFRKVGGEAAVPLFLLPLHHARAAIEALLAAWSAAVDDTSEASPQYGPPHEALLQTDTIRVFDGDGVLTRLVVLPTHPWMLAAMLEFQDRNAANIRGAKDPRKAGRPEFEFDMTREEIFQLVPRTILEHWYVSHGLPRGALRLTDSAPFYLEFLPEDRHVHRTPLDYVGRVVANKVGRYLRMHPHLRDERRTLRIGFVNPGDGQHLLEGLLTWLRNLMREHAGRIRELPMAEIPSIEVYLFAKSQDVASAGSELARFIQEQLSSSDEEVVRDTLAARLQYRVSIGAGPLSTRDAVHLCFVHGLVDGSRQTEKLDRLGDGWDGAFGNGLLATWLRSTRSTEDGPLHSRRGLWIDPHADGLRGALARVVSLQRACRYGDVARDGGIFWESDLPELAQLAPTYRYSDWVVHLDRELSLDVFRRGIEADRPTIIEYTDQEVPESPGYDTITVTKQAEPYREQLGEILTTADLDIAGRTDEARRAANQILDDINALSGSWALDFLLGSIADQRMSTRLKGNVGAALVYRWLKRTEFIGTGAVDSNVGEVVPVVISLEDLLRATPAARLSQKEGLVYRYTNEVADENNKEAARWCDDLLVLYLTATEPGMPSRLYGRVIEVKFGKTAGQSQVAEKAVGQVRNTQRLLQERLAGASEPLDAPFRNKQLSLLIKAQLEQAVAMGAMSAGVLARLNLPALSANLATGRYEVEYELSSPDGQHLRGDAFLLDTTESLQEQEEIEVTEGVRVITIPRRLVEWLAFELDESPTLTERPTGTFPRLGRIRSAQTNADVTRRVAPAPPPPRPAAGTPTASAPVQMLLVNPLALNRESVPHKPLPAPDPLPASTPEAAHLAPVEAHEVLELPSEPEPARSPTPVLPTEHGLSLEKAAAIPVKMAPYPDDAVIDVVKRLERALVGHKVRLTSSPSARETDRGPRLLRAYVRLEAGESIGAVRRISEDIARVVGTTASDIHITNVPERHAVGLDLPLPGLTYSVSFDEVVAHVSFEAAQRELRLGFCAGIDVTGRAVWVDLTTMPHMLVAGTTGSGKTVFLRNLILTLLLNNGPNELVLRLSSSKPMDFKVFTQAPQCGGRDMARDPTEAKVLADELVAEMERRYRLLEDATCDNLAEYNAENPGNAEPFIVAVFDEYAEMIASFGGKQEREAFESAIGRLAQKARAAGIHLVICMQRPDAIALKGAIKANILHRFALKLPQNQDSRIILDENGAETLLGQGDMLYKDANSRLFRLQVPFLENVSLKRALRHAVDRGPRTVDDTATRACPKCGRSGTVGALFGTRRTKHTRQDGTEVQVERAQSYCKFCRSTEVSTGWIGD